MSCWVAPTLAAEIWQISLELLMSRIASGEIPVRDEDGFLFVDVAPYGSRIERPNKAPHERPAMCTPADPDDTFSLGEYTPRRPVQSISERPPEHGQAEQRDQG